MGWGLALASCRWTPEMLGSIVQCTEWSPEQGIFWSNVSIVLRLKNPELVRLKSIGMDNGWELEHKD